MTGKKIIFASLALFLAAALTATVLWLAKDRETEFICDITDGGIVTDKSFEFTASATLGGKPLDIRVLVNGVAIVGNDHKYIAPLAENINTVKLISTASPHEREYTVRCEAAVIEFDTDITEFNVKNDVLTFSAVADYGGIPCALTVTADGETIDSDTDSYEVILKKGINVVYIRANCGGAESGRGYVFEYGEFVFFASGISVGYTYDADLPFTVFAVYSGGDCSLEVFLNGQPLLPEGNGGYNAVLRPGSNTFVLTAAHANMTNTIYYTVTYLGA